MIPQHFCSLYLKIQTFKSPKAAHVVPLKMYELAGNLAYVLLLLLKSGLITDFKCKRIIFDPNGQL